jgi:hypothetical protein
MNRIDEIFVSLAVNEATADRDKTNSFGVEYVVTDLQTGRKFASKMDLASLLPDAAALLFEVYSAINAKEGTSYDPGSKPNQKGLTAEEENLIAIRKLRLAEYPSVFEQLEADYDLRKGDTTKRDALDAKIESVRKKYPMPRSISPSAWARVKSFFGF